MRKWLLAAALLLTGARFALAAAPDPATFNAVAAAIPVPQPDKYDERAVLAALLARPDMADQFNADGKEALSDPQLKAMFVAKWRGKAAAFATTDVNRGGPDLSKQYHNWKEVLGPEGYAYTRQRLLTMSKDNVDKLIGYLGLLDEKLKNNNYKIDDGMFAISGKIVNGILDAYRKDLGFYLADPAAQAARAAVPQVSQQLAAAIQSKNAVASAPPQAPATQPAAKPGTQPAKPPVKPAKPETPAKPAKPGEPAKPAKPEPPAVKPEAPAVKPETPVVVTNPSGGALDQARGAEHAGPNGGQVFDGGGRSGTPEGGSAVVVPPAGSGGGVPPGTLTPPSQLPGQPPVVGNVPSPLDDLDARVAQAGASGVKPYAGKAKLIGTGGGALLGGLLGFLLGGPIGLAIGAAAGAAVGYFAAHKLLQ